MASVYQVIILLIIHWIGDFLLQTSKMAENKSTSNYWLSMHIITYITVWVISGIIYVIFVPNCDWISVILFCICQFIFHYITDYITSRITSKLYAAKKWRKFFRMIGFDQILHYVPLFICYDHFIQTL